MLNVLVLPQLALDLALSEVELWRPACFLLRIITSRPDSVVSSACIGRLGELSHRDTVWLWCGDDLKAFMFLRLVFNEPLVNITRLSPVGRHIIGTWLRSIKISGARYKTRPWLGRAESRDLSGKSVIHLIFYIWNYLLLVLLVGAWAGVVVGKINFESVLGRVKWGRPIQISELKIETAGAK